ncbi:hypothetical protein SUGI_0098340 [Cryptomeria japonica]|nr:hypothetical protein SUGI_0098340 [Cryptomeria japonica]
MLAVLFAPNGSLAQWNLNEAVSFALSVCIAVFAFEAIAGLLILTTPPLVPSPQWSTIATPLLAASIALGPSLHGASKILGLPLTTPLALGGLDAGSRASSGFWVPPLGPFTTAGR